MSIRDAMRDEVAWRSRTGEGTVPGGEDFAPAQTLRPARKIETQTQLGGDRVANTTWWVLPENDVRAGDLLADAEVLETSTIRDRGGTVLVRVCYARG